MGEGEKATEKLRVNVRGSLRERLFFAPDNSSNGGIKGLRNSCGP